jgi:protocatechuate 3,4-dioxygenase beta subunit
MTKKIFFFLFIFLAYKSFAIEKPSNIIDEIDAETRETIFQCNVTKNDSKHILPKPRKFHHSNNLTRKSKDVFFSQGESIIIEGYILDKNCVPITNASIQLWQSNSHGLNQEGLNAKKLAYNQKKLEIYDPHFSSNGSTSSDNTGFYRFILIRPCGDYPRKIDMSAKHRRFKSIEKIVSLDDKHQNIITPCGKKALEYELIDIHGCEETCPRCPKNIKTGGSLAKYTGKYEDQDVYRFDIVLSGREEYRKY